MEVTKLQKNQFAVLLSELNIEQDKTTLFFKRLPNGKMEMRLSFSFTPDQVHSGENDDPEDITLVPGSAVFTLGVDNISTSIPSSVNIAARASGENISLVSTESDLVIQSGGPKGQHAIALT